ncbi:phosphonate ABC transporter, permease protein PhnE [Sphingomonas oleivorans]|uniref:Phosphonate ABC transporter, permease protein PhnE n=1 Tax=Sphingomonas oleivorans TaxID=1735121 RepID=A0A2T5FV97_9SPHN|nr:phosphonate ABC transporter, permease protein PhnE [Sphingomonas oleivorans]PTQ08866.1 phosphonate ABC transporter, permease protein PhnE [Sphingomonas oleivorans]
MNASPSPAATWHFPRPYGLKTVAVAIAAFLLLCFTGQRIEMDRMVAMTGAAALSTVGAAPDSEVAKGIGGLASKLWPPQISERTEVSRIENFDPAKLPLFSYVETVETQVQTLNPETLQMETHVERSEYLVERFGYLRHVFARMIETLEIALWGTILAVLMGFPLALLGARNFMPWRPLRAVAGAVVSLLRSIPEMISALFLVLAYGFGPIAGVLALALHAAGFLGKFYAEDMENADPRPQEALIAIGATQLKLLRHAILPQVIPQYIAYTLYILDRNMRMATIIGLVGAGGIGQELKGRYDMYDYGHVGTILVTIFLVVLLLDRLSARLRRAAL